MAQLTKMALDAIMPLVRPSSYISQLTENLWGLYTPSTGVPGVLFFGTKEELEQKIEDAKEDQGYFDMYFPEDKKG
jgi:hypothetical protein